MSKLSYTRGGFTLLELAIVLGLIAILTHLAVRETSQWRRGQLSQRANRQLDELRVAIMGDNFERNFEGVRIRSGFVADMGRLPQATNQVAGGPLSLAELWLPPAVAERYDVRPAIASNLVDSLSSDADGEVFVAGGWRGPYVRLPAGAHELRDAWGNPFTVPDEAGYDQRLRGPDKTLINKPGQTIAFIRHLGADGRFGGEEEEPLNDPNRDVEVNLLQESTKVNGISSVRVVLNVYSNNVPMSVQDVTFRIYSPFGGKIKVASKPGVKDSSGEMSATFTDLTSGPRMLRVEFKTYSSTESEKSRIRPIMLQPGANPTIFENVYR